MNPATNSSNAPDTNQGSITVMTLYIEDSMYAIPIDNVVSLSKETDHIQPLPIKAPGLLGVSHFLGSVVPVLDVASRIGVKSGTASKQEMIETLTAREQEHVEWLDALERSIKTGERFSKARDPHECAFGQWYDNFDSRNEALREIFSQFDAPHRQIHSLADKLLSMRDAGNKEAAIKELNFQRSTTLRRLRSLFSHARLQLQELMRPILLYVTQDGNKPAFALLIDEVHDALTYDLASCHSPEKAGFNLLLGQDKFIKGVFSDAQHPKCILLDVDNILKPEHLHALSEAAA